MFYVWSFAFDDKKGNAIDEADNIGAAGLATTSALDLILGSDVENVVPWVLPIDVADGNRVGSPARAPA